MRAPGSGAGCVSLRASPLRKIPMSRPLPAALLVCSILTSGTLAAQEVRTWVETRTEGVFVRTAPAHVPAAPLANPNPSPIATRWTWNNPPGQPWISEYVSVGNRGTLAWVGQTLNAQMLAVCSTTEDNSPPVPVWTVPMPGYGTVIVRAADDAPVAAVSVRTSAGVPELRAYRAYQSTPLLQTVLPLNANQLWAECDIDDAGRYLTAGYDNASGHATVAVYDLLSANPTVPVQVLTSTTSGHREHRISGDGKTVLIATHRSDALYDVATGNLLFEDGSAVSVDAHTIAHSADTFARGGFDVGAWKRSGTSWNRVLTFNDATLGFGIYTACALSKDGTTYAVAATDANTYQLFRVFVWRLTSTGSTLLWTYQSAGSGTLQTTPTAVSVSDDGRWIGVGSWGTGGNTPPEALLFDRDAGNVPVATIDAPGSVFDLDLAPDGQFLLAGTKAVHANTFGNGGIAYCLDRGGQGHRAKGTPAIGRGVIWETGGNPGEPVVLLTATALLPIPVPVPGFVGTLELDLSQSVLPPIVVGTVPAGGVHALALTIPNAPSAVGVNLWSQTARLGSPPEIENKLLHPILP